VIKRAGKCSASPSPSVCVGAAAFAHDGYEQLLHGGVTLCLLCYTFMMRVRMQGGEGGANHAVVVAEQLLHLNVLAAHFAGEAERMTRHLHEFNTERGGGVEHNGT
jgi:hypothetical protein